jgi:hypothetical protein
MGKKRNANTTTNGEKKRRGAPFGNTNRLKNMLWSDAIRRAIARAAKGPRGEGNYAMLNKLADALVKKGLKGDVSALKELGDRIDGKVPQGIEGPGPEGQVPVSITVKYE